MCGLGAGAPLILSWCQLELTVYKYHTEIRIAWYMIQKTSASICFVLRAVWTCFNYLPNWLRTRCVLGEPWHCRFLLFCRCQDTEQQGSLSSHSSPSSSLALQFLWLD